MNEMSDYKNIIELTLPDPQDQYETQFYQNVKTKFTGHQDGIWLNSDTPGDSNKKLAICTFICQRRGKLFEINKNRSRFHSDFCFQIALNEMTRAYFVIKRSERPMERRFRLSPYNPMARFCFGNIRSTDQDKNSQNENNLYSLATSTESLVLIMQSCQTIHFNGESSQVLT